MSWKAGLHGLGNNLPKYFSKNVRAIILETLKQKTGSLGEEMAAAHLEKQGFRLIARNWRKGSYELDIICADRGTLVFVEVKTRGEGSLEDPEQALTAHKRRSLLRAAGEYLKEADAWDCPCRFDLVCVRLVDGRAGKDCLEHIENVVEFDGTIECAGKRGRFGGGSPLDSGHTPWQPW